MGGGNKGAALDCGQPRREKGAAVKGTIVPAKLAPKARAGSTREERATQRGTEREGAGKVWISGLHFSLGPHKTTWLGKALKPF